MTKCPNCGQSVTNDDKICPTCGFNLAKYRQDYFSDNEKPIKRRAEYRKEFKPEKQNSTVQKMIAWIRNNATIVFLLGIGLLIVMSFSRSLGWILFLILMIWLFLVCERADKIEQYTSDRRLTEKLNQIGSNTVNTFEDHQQKIRQKGKEFEKSHPRIEEHAKRVKEKRKIGYSYTQLSVILTAFISLVVLFSNSGATAVVNNIYDERMSISRVLLGFGGKLLASHQTALYSLIIYVVWLLLIIFPILIIYNIFKNTKKSQLSAFVLSLIETLFLIFVVMKMSSGGSAGTSILSQLTTQLLTYAVSVGASTYFLIIASILTTVLSFYNLIHKKQDL